MQFTNLKKLRNNRLKSNNQLKSNNRLFAVDFFGQSIILKIIDQLRLIDYFLIMVTLFSISCVNMHHHHHHQKYW